MEPDDPRGAAPQLDPRYQVALEPGWWKTGAGWLSILKSHRVDRRAKPVVIALIVALFFLFVYITDGAMWGLLAVIAGLMIIAVLVFSPLQPSGPIHRQPLEPGWWKTVSGWKSMPLAGHDEPGMGVVGLVAGLLLGGFVLAIRGWDSWYLAAAFVLLSSRGLVSKRYAWLLPLIALAVLIAGFALAGRG